LIDLKLDTDLLGMLMQPTLAGVGFLRKPANWA
jgi:hypothetical protein